MERPAFICSFVQRGCFLETGKVYCLATFYSVRNLQESVLHEVVLELDLGGQKFFVVVALDDRVEVSTNLNQAIINLNFTTRY